MTRNSLIIEIKREIIYSIKTKYCYCVSNSQLQSKYFLDNDKVMQDSLSLYPLFVSLEQKHCLIVGLGAVGTRKLVTLLSHNPATVSIVDRKPVKTLSTHVQKKLEDSRVTYHERCFAPEDLQNKFLVIAATNDASINKEIAFLCKIHNTLCNCITNPTDGDVFLPAIAKTSHLSLALSTSGASPALARRWRKELQAWIDKRERMATLMARLRPHILALQKTSEENTHLFHLLVDSPIQEWLAQGEWELCKQCLFQILPAQLHGLVTELFDDFA